MPVALLFERTPNGASHARMYSTPALRVSHPRSLRIDPHAAPGRDPVDVLTRLARTLREGDVAASTALFEPEATVQHADGALSRASAQIRATLEQLLRTGAADPSYCTRLDDAARTALELQLRERPALLVCERGAGGLLSAVRLYA